MNILIIAGIILIIIISFYNSMVSKKNQVENNFATMDVMLKKRYDLIPNIVATVKNYAKYEGETLEKITALRSKTIQNDKTTEEKILTESQLTKEMRSIMISAENYPELKANENFLHLQKALNEVEEQISAARRSFNAAVIDYNNALEMFPTNIFGNLMSYKKKELFEILEDERKNINVNNLFNN